MLWKTWAPLRIKIFMWLAFRRRLWTADRRRRHGLQTRDACYLCDQEPESIHHLLVHCAFTRQAWSNIAAALGVTLQAASEGVSVLCWWTELQRSWSGTRKKGFDSLFMLSSWVIWKERNARCFRECATTIGELLLLIKHEVRQWTSAGAVNLERLISM